MFSYRTIVYDILCFHIREGTQKEKLSELHNKDTWMQILLWTSFATIFK